MSETQAPTQSTEMIAVTAAVAEFDRVAAGIADLKKKYDKVVFDVATTSGMAQAKAARLAVRQPRYEIERIRKDAKAPILALGKHLDTEAKRITTELLAIEGPIDQAIKNEEDRKERERLAKIEAERQRVAALQERVAELRGNQSLSASSGSALLAQHVEDLEALIVDDSFQEFEQQARDAKAGGLGRLREILAAAIAHEAEQARIQAEREELARLREADEKRRAEEEERARVEREAAIAKAQAKLREEREAEARRQAAERARIAEEERIAAEARERMQMAMSEIQGIQQQVIIASAGRLGVRQGGTIECIRETLAETEAWPIDADRFGTLTESAQQAKDAAIANIRNQLAVAEQRIADQEAQAKLAADRAEFERQQAEARRAEEEAARVKREQARIASLKKPSDDEMIGVLATHYSAPPAKVVEWLRAMDLTAQEAA